MKKILFFCAALLLVSCSSNSTTHKDEGVRNAEQFVKEKRYLNMDNVESVDGEVQDSLLGILHLSFAENEALKFAMSYYNGEITENHCRHLYDSISSLFADALDNWQYNGINNEELRKNRAYDHCWHKVVNVTIKYKSQTSETVRVLMDSNGKTPWKLDEEVIDEIVKTKKNIRPPLY